MSWKNVKLEVSDNIATISVNRPKQLNALNIETLKDISGAFEEAKTRDDVKGVLLTGAGDKAFVAGADIAQMLDMNLDAARVFAKLGQDVLNDIENLPKPVIAVVNGYALGGGLEIAMSCDIIIASEKARFGQPEVKLGIIPGFGGTQRLVRRVGAHLAKEIIFCGDMVKADRALAVGLINAVAPPDELMDKAVGMMKTILTNGPVAIQMAKAAINFGADESLSVGLKIERDSFVQCFVTEDRKEGMSAFVEKRDPEFKGK